MIGFQELILILLIQLVASVQIVLGPVAGILMKLLFAASTVSFAKF